MTILPAFHSGANRTVNLEILLKDLPGDVSHSLESQPTGDNVVEVSGNSLITGEKKYDCKFTFNFHAGIQKASINNFSIHDPNERGQGLGVKVISNLINCAKESAIKTINLTAELERGAFVWAKLGWVPNQTSFSKLQKKCQPKLDVLQQLIPSGEGLSHSTFGIFRDLLDSNETKDPKYIWAIVDSSATYKLELLIALQNLANIQDSSERINKIKSLAFQNDIVLDEPELAEADKTLRFIKNMDLENLSRDSKVSVSVLLFAWEQWKGELDLSDKDQLERLERYISKNITYYQPVSEVQLPSQQLV